MFVCNLIFISFDHFGWVVYYALASVLWGV